MKRASLFLFSFLLLIIFPSLSTGKELPKIAVWDLEARNTPTSHAKELTSILVSEIYQSKNYEVYSQENVRILAGWTAEKMKLGCTDIKCLTALGQMDIVKLISGSVGKIGNVYSISLSLFDTRNAKAENALSEFCRTEEELILTVQRGVRKLLGLSLEGSASALSPSSKSASIRDSAPSGSASLEGISKVRGAQRLMLDENYLVDKTFYFEDCVFGRDKFNHFIRFQRGGRLEGAPRPRGGVAAVSKGSIDFKPLDGRWLITRDKIIIHFASLPGISRRDIIKIEVEIGPDRKDFFPARSESSGDYLFPFYQWDGKTMEVFDCRMRELR